MPKPVLALAALAGLLSASGCCWPHGHHRGHYGYTSESMQPAPSRPPGHAPRPPGGEHR